MLLNDPCSKPWTQILKKVVQFASTLTEGALSNSRVWELSEKFTRLLLPAKYADF